MNRRLLRTWAAWLLPLLALRAFLPVGFMLSADADGLRLVFCPTQAPVAAQLAAAGAPGLHQQARSDADPWNRAAGADELLAGAAHVGHGSAPGDASFSPADFDEDPHAAHHGDVQLAPSCPYALAAVAIALGVAHPGVAAPPQDTTTPPAEHSFFSPGIGPDRADRIRGPPAYS